MTRRSHIIEAKTRARSTQLTTKKCFHHFFFSNHESFNSFKIFVSMMCLMTRWIINLFLFCSRISFLTFLFSFYLLFRFNLTMYKHFLKKCSSSHMHFSFFFELMKLSLLLFLLLCLFWLNDSFLIWSWVTPCSVAALVVEMMPDDDNWFSRIIAIWYVLMILKNSTDFSAASN